jgi:hypothetical protein
MENTEFHPTNAQQLAAMLRGTGKTSMVNATVQRSHRFPVHLFNQIENMAEMAGSPVSLIINLLLESGLESVKKELPPEKVEEITLISDEQYNRKVTSEKLESRPKKK